MRVEPSDPPPIAGCPPPWALLIASALASVGCVATSRVEGLPPVVEQKLERAESEASPVSARFERDGAVLRGQVQWAGTCRRIALEHARARVVTEKHPSRAAGTVLLFGAGGLATGALVTAAGQALDDSFCGFGPPSDGASASCDHSDSTPAALLMGSVVLLGAGLVLVAARPQRSEGPVVVLPSGPARTVESDVPCGDGPVSALRVAVYEGEQRIAEGGTDASGALALSLPPGAGGPLVVRVDSAPSGDTHLRVGDVVGTIEAAPGATP